MSHKVHPKIFRTKDLRDWDSRWLDMKNLKKFLEEDYKIRKLLDSKIDRFSNERIEVERSPGKLNIIISSARPGLIIGRGGGGVEELKRLIAKKILSGDKRKELKIEIREIKNPWLSARIAGQWIAQQLEKRISHRKALKQALSKIMANKEAKGARVEVAGRLDGAEIARRTWLKEGRMPRQNLRADIDYANVEAHCTYGRLGIKVWIYKGEKFSE